MGILYNENVGCTNTNTGIGIGPDTGGAHQRRCASFSSEYPFLTDITGKFVARSDMSKTSKTMHELLNGMEGGREIDRAHFCCVIFIDVRSHSTHHLD